MYVTEVFLRSTPTPLEKLSVESKRLLGFMRRQAANFNKHAFTLNHLRNLRKFGDTTAIQKCLFELEARGLGEIRTMGAHIAFDLKINVAT